MGQKVADAIVSIQELVEEMEASMVQSGSSVLKMSQKSPRVSSWRVLLFLASSVCMPARVDADAWTVRPWPSGYVELYYQFFPIDRDFNAHADKVPKPNEGRFREHRLEAKGEIGLWQDQWNLLFAVPVETASYVDQNVRLRTSGFEEIKVGLKYRFTTEPAPLLWAAQVTAKLPACDPAAQPPLADCQFDLEGRLILSKGLLGDPSRGGISRLFTSVELAYRARAREPADEIPYFFDIGFSLHRLIWFKGTVDGVQSRPFGLSGAKEDFTKFTAGLLFGSDPISRSADRATFVEVGVGNVIAGRSTGAGHLVYVKLAHQY